MQHLEDAEAIALSHWLTTHKYRFTHIANESGLPPKVAMLVSKKKKRMGVSPGFPDYLILLKRGSFLFLELKRSLTQKDYRKDGNLLKNAPHASEEQQCWLSMLDAIENAQASLAYGKNEAIMIILEAENL